MADQFTAGETFTEDEQVTFAKLNLAQTNLKFTSNAVDGSTTAISSEAIIVNSGGITATQLATDAVTTAKIESGAVVTLKIADDAVTVDKMAVNSIDTDQYVDGSIDEEHLSNDVITGQTALTAVPALTDTILISDTDDSGNLKKIDFMKYLPLPRAWGVVPGAGSPSTSTPVGLYGCACSDLTGKSYTFDLTTDMSSSNYAVIVSSHRGTTYYSSNDSTASAQIVDAGQFKIHVPYTAYTFHSAVFGALS